MKKIYRWKGGFGKGLRAEIAVAELERIGKSANGKIMPDMVVAAARPITAPLHPAFTWDDGEAAEKYRLHEARLLINHIIIVPIMESGEERESVRAFVSLAPEDDETRSYESIVIVMNDAEKRSRILSQALGELEDWTRRYHSFEEFSRLIDEVRHVKQTIQGSRVNSRAKQPGRKTAKQGGTTHAA